MTGWSYSRLPNSAYSASASWRQMLGNGKRRFIFIGITIFVLFTLLASHPKMRDFGRGIAELDMQGHHSRLPFPPPSYTKLKQYEDDLPQHNLDLPFPEGKTGRYVKFSNQIKYLGWNNVFNELLMNAHLAYESKRAYVFQSYVWKPEYYAWPREEFLEDSPSTPLNAIISGPTAGGLWEEGDPAPRSISEKWFDVVCPVAERRIISAADVKPDIRWNTGDIIFAKWKRLLTEAPERCIEVVAGVSDDGYPQTFDLFLWGSWRILSLWESFSKSPTSRLLGSSPIVNSAVDRNEYLFLPVGPRPAYPASRNPYNRMLAMHVRRGDFVGACEGLWTWNSTFYSWNLLDALPDKFVAKEGSGWGENTEENRVLYMEHCLPTFDAIVKKVRDSRADYVRASGGHSVLDVLYLLTNEQSEWLDQLKDVLKKDGWHTIRTSRDITLDQEQTDVNMAVDMDIARRAAVFIGNGWSSFTSNIVHRRLVDGKEPISIRFY